MMKRKWEKIAYNDFSYPIVCVKLARGLYLDSAAAWMDTPRAEARWV